MARRIALIVGSVRKDSFNLKLAQAIVKLSPTDWEWTFVRIDDLPLFNQDCDENPPEPVKRVKSQISASDALLFVTPEHNRGLPAALKNVLDWVARPFGSNCWAGKPGAVVGASIGSIGTALAQRQLRNILSYLDVPTLGQPEVYIQFKTELIDANGNVANDSTRKLLDTFVRRYREWIEKF